MLKRTMLLALVVAFATSFALNAFATRSRINSMGGGNKFVTVVDESNIWSFPSTIVDWGNEGLVDNFNGSTGEFGFHYTLNKDAVLVIYGGNRRTYTFAPNAGAAAGLTGVHQNGTFDQPGETSNWKGSIGFGMNSGGTKFGAILSAFGDNTAGNKDASRGPLGLKLDLGVGFGLGGNTQLDLGLGITFGILSATNEAGDTEFEGSDFGIDLGGRLFMDAAPGVQIIPYLGFNFRSESANAKGADATKASTLGITLGADLKIQPTDNVAIYPGAGFRFSSQGMTPAGGDETTTTNIAIPFFSLAIDAKITDWLDWRVGATHTDTLSSTNTNSDGPRSSSATVMWATGFGLQFGDWTIDLNVQPNFFNNGLYFITGNVTGSFAMDAALKYAW